MSLHIANTGPPSEPSITHVAFPPELSELCYMHRLLVPPAHCKAQACFYSACTVSITQVTDKQGKKNSCLNVVAGIKTNPPTAGSAAWENKQCRGSGRWEMHFKGNESYDEGCATQISISNISGSRAKSIVMHYGRRSQFPSREPYLRKASRLMLYLHSQQNIYLQYTIYGTLTQRKY